MTERTYAGYTLAELQALCENAPIDPMGMAWGRRNNEFVAIEQIDDDADVLYVAARVALPALCDRVAYLERLIAKMDAHAPRADRKSIEPGITYSEACRRQLRDDGDPLFQEARDD